MCPPKDSILKKQAKHGNRHYHVNQNYNKILERDLLSPARIEHS